VQKRQNQIKYPNFKTPRGTPGHGHGAAAGPPLQRGGCTTKLKIQISKLPGGLPRKGQNQIKVPNFRAPRGAPRHGAARGPIPRAGPPADRENTPTTNTTGTFGSDVAVGLVFDIFSRSARGPRQNSGTAYEKHNGDFRSEAAVGSLFDVFSLSPGVPATQRNRLRKTQRGLQVRSGRWILVRRVLPLAGCPGDTEETVTKIATGTSGPKRPLDSCSKCSPSRRVPGDTAEPLTKTQRGLPARIFFMC